LVKKTTFLTIFGHKLCMKRDLSPIKGEQMCKKGPNESKNDVFRFFAHV
jgi:hypothetical protein